MNRPRLSLTGVRRFYTPRPVRATRARAKRGNPVSCYSSTGLPRDDPPHILAALLRAAGRLPALAGAARPTRRPRVHLEGRAVLAAVLRLCLVRGQGRGVALPRGRTIPPLAVRSARAGQLRRVLHHAGPRLRAPLGEGAGLRVRLRAGLPPRAVQPGRRRSPRGGAGGPGDRRERAARGGRPGAGLAVLAQPAHPPRRRDLGQGRAASGSTCARAPGAMPCASATPAWPARSSSGSRPTRSIGPSPGPSA
jgi:hypothetical protein